MNIGGKISQWVSWDQLIVGAALLQTPVAVQPAAGKSALHSQFDQIRKQMLFPYLAIEIKLVLRHLWIHWRESNQNHPAVKVRSGGKGFSLLLQICP